MKVPFNTLDREYTSIKSTINKSIQRVLNSNSFILSNECLSLEKELAQYLNSKFVVTVGNGTDAITLALLANGITQGDEVITTSFTAYPTITGIERTGATPVVVDVTLKTGLIDSEKIEKAITKKTKAILPVHLYGQAAEIEKISHICKHYNLKLIEDCAQSFGSTRNGQMTGTFGDAGAFSFYPTKNLGAYGDGGAVCTQSQSVYKKLLRLRNYGQDTQYQHDTKGINSRLDEIQAAILREKLKNIDTSIKKRRKFAQYYRVHLSANILYEDSENMHTYHLFVITVKNRQQFQKYCASKGIATLVHYPIPVYKQKAFSGVVSDLCNNADILSKTVVSLPLSPHLTKNEIDYVIQTINTYFHEYA